MRVFLIIDETNFYHPEFAAELINNKEYEYVGAALVTKSILMDYMQKNWHFLKFSELARLSLKQIELKAKDKLLSKKKRQAFYSVSSVLDYYGIDYFEVERDIHTEEYLNFIRSKAPDVIISSNSLILRKKLLSIPKICSINRHSSLLPAYGGIWPVFHAYRKGEEFVGVTIHTMESKVDEGIILAQRKIKIEPHDVVDSLYKKCFDVSAEACFEALEKIRSGKYKESHIPPVHTPSYYSFPTKADWMEFRAKNGKFI